MRQAVDRLRAYPPLAVVDLAAWPAALALGAWVRYEFDLGPLDPARFAVATVVAVAIHGACGIATGLYVGRHRMGSFEESKWLAFCTGVTSAVVLMAAAVADPHLVPLGAVVSAAAFQLVGALVVRFLGRSLRDRRRRSPHDRTHRLLVFGAGDAGFRAVSALLADRETDLMPVAYLDDDPTKGRLRLHGLPIVGGSRDIASAASRYRADSLLIAMPSARREAIAEVADRAQEAGLAVKILPKMASFLTHGRVEVQDIREIQLSDFLGREEAQLDVESIAGHLGGRRVLVTGAGGSIGSALCAEVLKYAPGQLIMLDVDENALHALELSLEGRALLQAPGLVLADICDRATVSRVFDELRPEVVFHTAARKHVSFLERFPREAVKTNVLGTLNVLEAAVAVGIERFVNVSTDKAVDPVSVLGLTKRIGEMLTADMARHGSGFMSVRFGNVLGSKGSVIPIFREQIARDEPITVTHPEVTRYFMTVEEAVRLVVQGAVLGGGGDVFVLDMGEPVKIVDLARRLCAEIRPGTRPRIDVVGLRPGEKLHETLFSTNDEPKGRPHQLIWRFGVPPIDPLDVASIDLDMPAEQIVELLRRLTETSQLAPAYSAGGENADRLDD